MRNMKYEVPCNLEQKLYFLNVQIMKFKYKQYLYNLYILMTQNYESVLIFIRKSK